MLKIKSTKVLAQLYENKFKFQDISAFDKDLAESNRKKIELEARLEG